ncbi:MAG: caspase family protein [Nitrospirota bacterium]|nr:caspase family protein [Nitrospirota bacterium]
MMQQVMGKTSVGEIPVTEDGVQVVIQQGHTGFIQALAMSPDGRYVISGGVDETAKLWDLASGQELQSFPGFGMLGPRYLTFSKDSRMVVAADLQRVKVFDVSTGRELRTLTPLLIERVAISGNGQWMAASGQQMKENKSQRKMGLWDLRTGQTLPELPDSEDHSPLASDPDGMFLVTQQRENGGKLVLWDLAGRKAIRELGSAPDVFLAAVSPGAILLATQGEEDGILTVRETTTGEVLYQKKPSDPENAIGTSLAFSPDGRLLGLASFTSGIKIFDAETGKQQTEISGTAINFSPDNKSLILAKQTGGAPVLRDMESGKERAIAAGASPVQDFTITPDGQTLIAGMRDHTAKVWNLKTGEITGLIPGPASGSVSVSSDGRLVATGGLHGEATVWDADTQQPVKTLFKGNPDLWHSVFVRFTPDGHALAVGIHNRVTLWDTRNWKQLWAIDIPLKSFSLTNLIMPEPELPPDVPTGIQEMTFSPDGRMLALSTEGFAGVYHTSTGDKLYAIGGGGMSSLFDLALSGFGKNAGPSSARMNNPLDLHNQVAGLRNIKTLAFSPSGHMLFSVGMMGKQFWETDSGKPAPGRVSSLTPPTDPKQAMMGMEINLSRGGAFSPDGKIVAYSHGRLIKFVDLSSGEEREPLSGHTGDITSLTYSPDGRLLFSGAKDGTIRVWEVQTGKEQVSLISIGRENYAAVTPDQYYRLSKNRIRGVAFRSNGKLYPFDQFDLRFNRPDIILERLGQSSAELIQSYRQAYEKRLKKMGLTQEMLGSDFHLPELEILTDSIPVSVTSPELSIRVKAVDGQYTLNRLNVFVNDIPVYGTAGIPLPSGTTSSHEQDVTVPLVPGRNKIQVSVMNQQGTESLRQTVYTRLSAEHVSQNIYVVAIGVSQYQDKAYNLRYAAKDAQDLANVYQAIEGRPGTNSHVHILSLTDKKATRGEILKAKDWLMQSRIQDLVVVFAAGHGMTDKQSNYYFGTHDIDAQDPAANGLPYEEFEFLLDGIPALQKVLLLDTCFSGEIDKDEAVIVKEADPNTLQSTRVVMRSFRATRGVSVVPDTGNEEGAGRLSPEIVRFQQDWFADLRHGTGASVISSSSGNEYSLEGPQWGNGVFTYALVQGLKHRKADANGDNRITVSELQGFVIEQVQQLTNGGQNPTARRENLEYDFAVYPF